MVTVIDRDQRLVESAQKILEPFGVDPDLCLYSPQDNVDSLDNQRVKQWLDFVANDYKPLPTEARRVLLFLPCTKTKPYVTSLEHQRINARLLAEGFEPVGGQAPLPTETLALLPSEDPRLFDLSPLRRGNLEIARVVMSEPLAFVPYEYSAMFNGKPSPSANYDDPGLFENRGNAVSPWRSDSTAVQVSANRWRWGANEKRAYVEMHNVMAAAVAQVLTRLEDDYEHLIAWVAPGLTHRSFCLARDERSDHRVARSKRSGSETLRLIGANDHLTDSRRIEVMPSTAACDDARERLKKRLDSSDAGANAIFARGGGGATPLALPELLDSLMNKLDELQ